MTFEPKEPRDLRRAALQKMMQRGRNGMTKAWDQHVGPVLRGRGFTGSFPHFRRQAQTTIDILTVKLDGTRGRFAVLLATCGIDGFTVSPVRHVSPDRVTAFNVEPHVRLGQTAGNPDHWFHFDVAVQDSCDRAARDVLPLLDSQAEDYWGQLHE